MRRDSRKHRACAFVYKIAARESFYGTDGRHSERSHEKRMTQAERGEDGFHQAVAGTYEWLNQAVIFASVAAKQFCGGFDAAFDDDGGTVVERVGERRFRLRKM